MMVYIITIGLTFRIFIDVMFILVPPIRLIFERSGNERLNMNVIPGGMPEMQMRMSTMPKVRNGEMGPLGMQAFGNGGIDQHSIYNRYWGVSEAAIQAIEMNKQDSCKSSISFYFKDMFAVSMITGVLIILALTGVLQQLGFYIGNMVVNMMQSGI